MKRMLFGVMLFFGGLFGVIGLYLVAVQSPHMGADLTQALAGLGLIVHTVVAWVFLFVGFSAFTRLTHARPTSASVRRRGLERMNKLFINK